MFVLHSKDFEGRVPPNSLECPLTMQNYGGMRLPVTRIPITESKVLTWCHLISVAFVTSTKSHVSLHISLLAIQQQSNSARCLVQEFSRGRNCLWVLLLFQKILRQFLWNRLGIFAVKNLRSSRWRARSTLNSFWISRMELCCFSVPLFYFYCWRGSAANKETKEETAFCFFSSGSGCGVWQQRFGFDLLKWRADVPSLVVASRQLMRYEVDACIA